MKIQFLGAVDGVTGSRHLVEAGQQRLLLDCGLFQGWKLHRERNWQFPEALREVDAVVLSHAHLDHSGWLPALVKHGFRGPIHASPATCELARVLLLDSAHPQEEDARRANRYGYSRHAKALPLYTRADTERALGQFVPLPVVLQRLRRAQLIPAELPIFLDSPMALEATALYRRYGRLLRVPAREVATLCAGVRLVTTVQQSIRLSASHYPAVIISASGTATGGRVLHHLKVRAPDERNAVVFPGFQVGGSRGARLVAGDHEVKIHGVMVPVRAEVRHLQGSSAHADRGGLLAWLRQLKCPAMANASRSDRPTRGPHCGPRQGIASTTLPTARPCSTSSCACAICASGSRSAMACCSRPRSSRRVRTCTACSRSASFRL